MVLKSFTLLFYFTESFNFTRDTPTPYSCLAKLRYLEVCQRSKQRVKHVHSFIGIDQKKRGESRCRKKDPPSSSAKIST